MYYNLSGIPSDQPPKDAFWLYHDAQTQTISLKENDLTLELEAAFQKIHTLFVEKLFGSRDQYDSILQGYDPAISQAGLDAEASESKEQWKEICKRNSNDVQFNKVVYLWDCRNLIMSLQDRSIESKHLFTQFYKLLNTHSFLINDTQYLPESLQYASGPIVTEIFAVVTSLFVNLYSQLDFVTKIAHELQHLAQDFSTYPKLKREKVIFGKSKNLAINKVEGTLFKDSITIRMIRTLRSELVHNASFENNPKVYQYFENDTMTQKYILLPDMKNGYLVEEGNRKRFFSQNTMLNHILPDFIAAFWKRMLHTVNTLHKAFA